MKDKIKYNTKFISNFDNFILNEIKFSRKNIDYSLEFSTSTLDKEKQNYHVKFLSKNKNQYIIDFLYVKDILGPYKNKGCYNLSFTLNNQHILSDDEIYENPTNLKEQFDVLPKIIFITEQICNVYDIKILVVGLTKNEIKNKLYLDMIKSMKYEFKLGKSSINKGLDVYYIKV